MRTVRKWDANIEFEERSIKLFLGDRDTGLFLGRKSVSFSLKEFWT
ncbi:MAG: hypothetical protein GKB99_05390 [Methanocellales archaeon]|nr:hypothetical protein [Methanocellales archaeon]